MNAPPVTAPDEHRAFGFWTCLALVVGSMIGTGIFLLPATLAPYGTNAVWAWLIAIGGILCLAFVLAALARAYPEANGPYDYISPSFGAFTGFFVMWSYWITLWVSNAALAIGAVSYLSVLAPALRESPTAGASASIAFLVLFTLISSRGVRAAGGVQVLTSTLKVLPLVAVITIGAIVAAGFVPGEGDGLAAMPVSGDSIASAVSLAVFALLGFECAAVPAGRVHNPERNVALATIVGTILVGALYLLVTVCAALLLPAETLTASTAPLADVVSRYWGAGASGLVALFAAISALGALNGFTMLQGEVTASLARRGVFPALFARENRFGAPAAGLWIGCFLAGSILLTNFSRGLGGIFAFLSLLVTMSSFVLYVVAALVLLRLVGQGRMRGAGLVALAVIGIGFSLWVFYGAGLEATLWSLALVASAGPVYFLMRRAHSSRAAAAAPAAPAE